MKNNAINPQGRTNPRTRALFPKRGGTRTCIPTTADTHAAPRVSDLRRRNPLAMTRRRLGAAQGSWGAAAATLWNCQNMFLKLYHASTGIAILFYFLT
jgi:hypothetical protein